MKIFCFDCGIECKDKTRTCWVKFNRCIKCAIKKYPDSFPEQTVRRYNGKMPRISFYKTCPECKNLINKMLYTKKSLKIKTDIYICTNCRILYVFDSKLRIARTIEVNT